MSARFDPESPLPVPVPLDEPDFEELRQMVVDYVKYCQNEGEYCSDNDWDHYIFEQAVISVYGREIWPLLNEIGARRP